ncbi:MAG TPA: HD domain-containing protein [Deltaproteobacteria bacterium]|nr:HD domain-containing protein [Deltaproteobacteria bacterium]HIJ39508.1 HD domain-containing protein [Deltaproteobacteria bacterium]
MRYNQVLQGVRAILDTKEKEKLSPWACPSTSAIREKEEETLEKGHRQNFSVDSDRILHSLSYSRYIDKTQVFYLIKNDHITHRVLHVQLVSKIGRTIGRILGLNEDLIEAVSLGHDIGHAPFGHDGEKFLSNLCESYGAGPFLHNIQSVRSLQSIERKGRGWNLTMQVLDGILCHDGELHAQSLEPARDKNFETLYSEMKEKKEDATINLSPMTLEGCVVRMADTISYIGRDIEDAIRLGLINRKDLPKECSEILGATNGTIVYTLVEDLVANSFEKPFLRFSDQVGDSLKTLKEFNEDRIYRNSRVKEQVGKIRLMFELLFERFFKDLETGKENSDVYTGFLKGMQPDYLKETSFAGIVRDFIAGMTDEYFLEQCHRNLIPSMRYGLMGSSHP